MSARKKGPAPEPVALLRFTVDPDGILRLGRDDVPETRGELYDLALAHNFGVDALREAIRRCPPLQAVIVGFAAARRSTIEGDAAEWALKLPANALEELRTIVTNWLDSPWEWTTDAARLGQEHFAIASAALLVRETADFHTKEYLQLSLVEGRFDFDQRQAARIGMPADEANARAIARDLPYRFTPLFPVRLGPALSAEDRKRLYEVEQVMAMEFAKLTFLMNAKGYRHWTYAIRDHIGSQVREALIEVRQLVRYHLAHGTPPRATLGAAAHAALVLCQRHTSFAQAAVPVLEWVVQMAKERP